MSSRYTYIRPNADEKNVLGVIVYEKEYTEDEDFIGEYLFKDKECTEPILKADMLNLLEKFKIIVKRFDGSQCVLREIMDIISEVDENGEELPEEEWIVDEYQYCWNDEDGYLFTKLHEFGLYDSIGLEQPSFHTAYINADGDIEFDVFGVAGDIFAAAERFLKGEGPCPTVLLRNMSDDRFSAMTPVELGYNESLLDGYSEYVRFLGYVNKNYVNSGSMRPSYFDIQRKRTSDDTTSIRTSTIYHISA